MHRVPLLPGIKGSEVTLFRRGLEIVTHPGKPLLSLATERETWKIIKVCSTVVERREAESKRVKEEWVAAKVKKEEAEEERKKDTQAAASEKAKMKSLMRQEMETKEKKRLEEEEGRRASGGTERWALRPRPPPTKEGASSVDDALVLEFAKTGGLALSPRKNPTTLLVSVSGGTFNFSLYKTC